MKTITIAGNVGKDSELRDAGQDKVLSFSVAVNDKKKGSEKTLWFDVSIWGRRGEALREYITKGSRVVVAGELDTHEANGKTYLKVRADQVTLMGGKPNGNRSDAAEPSDGPEPF